MSILFPYLLRINPSAAANSRFSRHLALSDKYAYLIATHLAEREIGDRYHLHIIYRQRSSGIPNPRCLRFEREKKKTFLEAVVVYW